MSLAIIIVSYNTRDLLAACLESLRLEIGDWRLETEDCGLSASPNLQSLISNLQSPVSVFVVDNHSPDGSADMVRERFPWVQLMASQVNLGFAGGNNLALRALGFGQKSVDSSQRSEVSSQTADGASHTSDITDHGSRITDSTPDFVLLLNPDTTVEPGAVKTLLDFMRRTPLAGAVGARLSYPDGKLQHSAFAFPGLMQTTLDLFPPRGRLARIMDTRLNGRYPRAWYERDQAFEVETLLGACIFARREAIQAAGLLDEGFFMYAEELDWCRRIHTAGYKLYCVPTARIVHYEGQSTRQFREPMFIELWRSRLRLFQKHHGPLRQNLLRAMIWLGATWGRLRADPSRRTAYRQVAELAIKYNAQP